MQLSGIFKNSKRQMMVFYLSKRIVTFYNHMMLSFASTEKTGSRRKGSVS